MLNALLTRPTYRIMAVLALLLQAIASLAQLTMGGDVAGGYTRLNSNEYDDDLKHTEGKADLWLGYKTKHYDWRMSLSAKYRDLDSESRIDDISVADNDSTSIMTTLSSTNDKPFNLSARYDFNWRQPNRSNYSLWALYDYKHVGSNSSIIGLTDFINSDFNVFGRYEEKKDVSHRMSAGYRGTSLLDAHGNWVLHSNADVMLMKRKVNDGWMRYQVDFTDLDDAQPTNVLAWEMNPDYTDYAVNAALHLTDTVYSKPASRLLLGGGIRFKGEGEHFRHDAELSDPDVPEIKPENVFINQHATGFRYFVEPFACGDWVSGKCSLNAEYGLRLYHTNTTDKTGHAVALYNIAEKGHPLSGNSFTHFTPLVTGRSKLKYTLSKHHSLTLTNSLSNRLPTNQQTVLCFVQMTEFNKVFLGNPHIKPEVRMQLGLDHTLTSGPFSATTGISAERNNNQMSVCIYNCTLAERQELALMMQNVADVTTYKLSETFAWNSKWLKASATLWGQSAHHKGIGSVYGFSAINDNCWGWKVDTKVNLGYGWLIATDFQFASRYKTISSEVSRMWQSSTASIEKRFGHITLYLNASNLIDPITRFTNYDTKGNMIYLSERRANNRIFILGCRWSF